jgi:hypothetical protein
MALQKGDKKTTIQRRVHFTCLPMDFKTTDEKGSVVMILPLLITGVLLLIFE